MKEEQKIQVFDKYRSGQLSVAEQATFETDLTQNPLLKVEYQDYLDIVEGVRLFERENLKAFLTAKETEEIAEPETAKVVKMRTSSKPWIWAAAAAAVVLLLMIPIYNHLSFEEHLYAKHRLEVIVDNTMSGKTDLWQNQKDYFEGVKSRRNEEFDVALTSFEKVTTANWNPYFKAQYEMALIHIKLGDTEKGKSILNHLISLEEKHFVKTKAKALLYDLEQPSFRFFR